MKFLLLFALLGLTHPAFADLGRRVRVGSCREYGVTLQNVVELRSFARGDVKIFSIDMIEPAGKNYGVAIVIQREGATSTAETFCRYIPYLAGVDIAQMEAMLDKQSNFLTLVVPIKLLDSENQRQPGTLTLVVKKAGHEANLVKAWIR